MTSSLAGKVAVVTGAGRGIGAAIGRALAEAGAAVALADVNVSEAEAVADEIRQGGGQGLAVRVDVTEEADVAGLIGQVEQELGRIDILVNNAGICPRTQFEQITAAEWDKVLGVNLKGVFLVSQRVMGRMRKQGGGVIVNLASGAGKVGGVQAGAHYAASKAGVICLTKTLATEGATYGVRANAVCPGVIETEMTRALPAEKIAIYEAMIPLGRLGEPRDVANAVVFLVSDEARYITGEILDVNGGFIMD